MIKLPEEFTDRMQKQLGDSFEEFLACYIEDGYAGLRVNTGKISVEDFLALTPFSLTPVPWTSNGFYYRKDDPVTRHPHYYAGLYYIQEPSAMLPASRLPVHPGDMVLDLCAAPGGKATELSSRMEGEGLLIANDASASRGKALIKNLAVWGSRESCITGEKPQILRKGFGCCFDCILVDAPCSGEGMFRKDAGLIRAWMDQGPEQYAPLQLEILDQAVQMLRPGGWIAYSTCTFSREEDEEVIEAILKRYPELILQETETADGFSAGDPPCEKAVRLWPHRIKGEGHFFALMKKQDIQGTSFPKEVNRRLSEAQCAQSYGKMPKEAEAFLKKIPERIWKRGVYEQIGEQCFVKPPYQLPKLRYLRTGLQLGTLKKGRFEPSQALAMTLKKEDYSSVLDLPSGDERVIRYLKGETIPVTEREGAGLQGWTLICTDGFGLGWGKYINEMIKNKYYSGWRMQ